MISVLLSAAAASKGVLEENFKREELDQNKTFKIFKTNALDQ
jgi:hypothetical protein